MKYAIKILSIILVLFSCNSEPKKEEPAQKQMAFGAVAPEISYMPNGDTVVWTQTTKTFSYPVWTKTIKPKATTTTPVPVPTGTKYLSLAVSGPLDYSGKSNVIIENKRITNASGVALKLYSGANNITIRNCFFDGATGELVELENATNITIENCLFARGLAGVYAVGSKGIIIRNCQFVNMRARYVNGGFAGRGVFAQFNSCSDMQVIDCKGENFQNESDPEDMISFFSSSNGVVKNNIFRGGGPSTSGGGIIMGDNGGNNVVAENNTLMNPGQYGMAIAGGTNMKILNNKIYSEKLPWSNNPLYVWAQGNQVGISNNATITGNRVNWTDKNGSINNGWNAGNIANTVWQAPTTITLAEMNMPAHLITFVTEAELLTIRK